MAEIDYAQAGEPAPKAAGISTFVNIGGAVMSLVLMVGVGVWGYKLLSRDVTGVPVVQAIKGPMRIAPEDPGGRPADHQGLAVNDVAAQGTATAPADRLVLAPQPVRLMAEDQPVTRDGDTGLVDVSSTTEITENSDVAALVEQLTQGVEPLQPNAETEPTPVVAVLEPKLLTEDEPAEAKPETAEPLEDDKLTEDTAEAEAAEEEEIVVVTGPGVARSLRPRERPARGDIPQVTEAAAEVPATEGLDVNPDDLPVGTRLAQLGAYDTPEIAQAEWDRIYDRFGDYMDGKKRVIQQASSGGRSFYRLRAMGFADLSDARRFCAVLVADNADCIPVTTR
ncbi:MAG: SPOR domain-containing protein [Paracoccaceae bacterium]